MSILKNIVEKRDNYINSAKSASDLFFGDMFGNSSPMIRQEEIKEQANNAIQNIGKQTTNALPEVSKMPAGAQQASNSLSQFFTSLNDTLSTEEATVNSVDLQAERPLENPLNEYKISYYNFQLFMADKPIETEAELIRLPREQRKMLSETGQTNVQIENLEILSMPGSASYNRILNPLTVRMTLTEQASLTLPTLIATKVKEFSAVNTTFKNVPIYLVVYFGAREDDNNPIAVPFGEKQKFTKGFKLIMDNIESAVDVSGSKYTISFTAQNFEGTKSTYAKLRTAVTITEQEVQDTGNNAKKLLETENSGSLFFKSYFDAIKEHVNNIKKKMSSNPDNASALQLELDSYNTFLENEFAVRFEGFNDPSVFDFVYKTDKSQDSDHKNEIPFDLKFDKDLDILVAIRRMMENTKIHHALAKSVPKSNIDTESGLGYYNFYDIGMDCHMIKTDQDIPTNKNYYKIIYTIKATKLSTASDNKNPPILKRDKLLDNAYVDYGVRLYKYYPYYFTGQNDSVISFNISLDTTWFYNAVDSRSGELTATAAPGKTKQQGDPRIKAEGQAEDSSKSDNESTSIKQEIERTQIDVGSITTKQTEQDGITDDTRDGAREAATIKAKELLDVSMTMVGGEIVVKGDPDWFAYDHPEYPFVYVEVNTIDYDELYDSDDPVKEFETEPLVTNLYQVISIEDKFNEGEYTQTLKLLKKGTWTVEK